MHSFSFGWSVRYFWRQLKAIYFRICVFMFFVMNQLFISFSLRVGAFVLFLGMSLSWGGCTPPTPLDKEAFVPPKPIVWGPYHLKMGNDTLLYTIYHKAAYEHNPDEYSQSDSTTIRLVYPLIDSLVNSAVRNRINTQIKAILLQETHQYKTVEERLEGFLAEFRVHKKDMQEFGLPSSNWAFDMQLSVLTNTPAVFALKIEQVEFTGGAHANSWTSYKNYHATSGKELQLEDLFYDNNQEAWMPLARAAFWEAWQEQDGQQQVGIVDHDTTNFVLPPNFSIGSNALHFYYNPYELDAYAITELTFSLSYTDLLPFVDTSVLPLEAAPIVY